METFLNICRKYNVRKYAIIDNEYYILAFPVIKFELNTKIN